MICISYLHFFDSFRLHSTIFVLIFYYSF